LSGSPCCLGSVHRVEASEKKKTKTTRDTASVTAANTKTIRSAL